MRDSTALIPALVATTIAVTLAISLTVDDPAPRKEDSTAPASIDQLQSLATAACKCAHYGKPANPDACWSTYKEATAKFEVSKAGSACDPISDEVDVVSAGGKELGWVYAGFRVVGLPDDVDPMVCTSEDARAVEAAGHEAFERAGGVKAKNSSAAQNAETRAYIEVLASIHLGKRVSFKSAGGGC